jgi:hypothetical protein
MKQVKLSASSWGTSRNAVVTVKSFFKRGGCGDMSRSSASGDDENTFFHGFRELQATQHRLVVLRWRGSGRKAGLSMPRYTRQLFVNFCLMGNVHSTRVPRCNPLEIVNVPPMTLARYFMF